MPPRIEVSNPARVKLGEIKIPSDREAEYKLRYPEKCDFRPGGKQHDIILDFVLSRAQDSANFMRQKHPEWRSYFQIHGPRRRD